ncbi:hypothetical protein SAMN02799630_02959 [Paenibacillus sp. UNCCL117]|uniref:hypothetical protein n=1 Tax=unclassified Paenibacillus TaxID=185978 RepID=UPI00088E9B85|nr:MULTISPECIES: hypothetical protein [unclassified Paenibacillus]SDD23290.1 hypothetical protein SAMN04488602_1076 [Paenibacillus sp. cl123]SFW41711.1 hypothetical protein SAMN02799630_02959 [Paenibacillus sp. UNCCL117]
MSIERGRVLLTGGRAPAALELARQLSAAGWTVFAAESADWHLCRTSRSVAGSYRVPPPAQETEAYTTALEQIVLKERIDWLVPTCEEIFYVSAGLDRLRRHCGVLTAPLGQLARLHSKWAFIRLAERLGFPVPATIRLVPGDAANVEECLQALAQESFAQGVILKPEFSRFAAKVRRFDRLEEARSFILQLHAGAMRAAERQEEKEARWREGTAVGVSDGTGLLLEEAGLDGSSREREEAQGVWVIQQWVRGRTLCTYGVAHGGSLRAHAVYESRYTAGAGATIFFEAIAHDGLKEWVGRFVREEDFSGQIAFDFIEDPEGVLYPLECNPRSTSGVHLFGPEDGLVQALLPGEAMPSEHPAEPSCGARAMLALPMLAYGLPAALAGSELGAWISRFRTARDVIYRKKDPGPFFEQARMAWMLGRMAAVRGISVMEASTSDIEWNGGRMR